jgi:hypothetical protein
MKLNEFEHLNYSKHNIILIYYSNKNNRNVLVLIFFIQDWRKWTMICLKYFETLIKIFNMICLFYCFYSKSLTENDDQEKKFFIIFNEHKKYKKIVLKTWIIKNIFKNHIKIKLSKHNENYIYISIRLILVETKR